MSRYDLPGPRCDHSPTGRVSAGGPDSAHASTYVCAREACIDDAKEWAQAVTRLPATFSALKGPGRG
jgi:hypothetical protein